jgi:DNA-directed RNA polymerase subunit omega
MARITVEDCLKHVENRFSLVLIAAARTKQILRGSQPLLDASVDNKEAVTALREIAAGLIEYYRRDPNAEPPVPGGEGKTKAPPPEEKKEAKPKPADD